MNMNIECILNTIWFSGLADFEQGPLRRGKELPLQERNSRQTESSFSLSHTHRKARPFRKKEVNFVGALFLERHKATLRGGRQQEEAMRLLYSVFPRVMRK